MPASLRDACVVVIGGSSGIGLATAKLAHQAGARVVIAGRDRDRLASAQREIGEGTGGTALDIADEAAVADLFASLDHVDHVANFAGTQLAGAVADLDTSAMQGPVGNRLWGPVHICKYAPAKMSSGSITLCTGAGVARPRPGNGIVMAAAGAAEVFARAMALELAPIRVNVVRPGIIDTPMLAKMAGDRLDEVRASQAKRVPLGRVGQPEEIAHAVEFLMANEYVTGTILTVDGGFSAG